MINAKDKSAQVALNAKVQAASAKLDSVLAGMTGAETKAAADFKAVWDQFKATREEEIIPAIYKGNIAEAKKITDGINTSVCPKCGASCPADDQKDTSQAFSPARLPAVRLSPLQFHRCRRKRRNDVGQCRRTLCICQS
jgi:uncharacterized paraquat-inducible protein A